MMPGIIFVAKNIFGKNFCFNVLKKGEAFCKTGFAFKVFWFYVQSTKDALGMALP